jgi:uncharacterized protein (DUF1501 family)
MTRRKFLIASGVTGAAALAAGAGGMTWHELAGRVASDPLQHGAKILVIVTLYGGNDGLNTLIPYADKTYHDLRPELAYAEDEVLHLDDQLGLNPGMTGFAKLWQANELAIVRGVGYPKPDHSHFRSMDIWQTASPDQPLNTGWIGRWLDITGDDPLRAVNIGSVVPSLAVGAHASAASLPLGKTKPLDSVLTNALLSLGQTDPTDTVGEGWSPRRTVPSARWLRPSLRFSTRTPPTPTRTQNQRLVRLVARAASSSDSIWSRAASRQACQRRCIR